jgi:hypothetical protein
MYATIFFFFVFCGIVQGLCKDNTVISSGKKKTKINDNYVFFIDT